jgi:anti-anti-sigma factor
MELLVAALHSEGIMLKVHAKKSDAVTVLYLEGQIINGDTEALRSAAQPASNIILNLSKVTILDAHGLGVLLELREQALAKGAHFELINVSKRLYRIFEITRLHTVFDIRSTFQFFPLPYSQRVPVAA